MAIPKAASIGLGLMMFGFGAWQMARGVGLLRSNAPDLHWRAQRATTLEVGDFTIQIPTGWRDAAEAEDQRMKDLLAKQPTARILVREKFDGEMAFFRSGPSEPVGDKPPCNELATAIAQADGVTASNISEQAYGGDPGCRWNEKSGKVSLEYNVRFHGTQILLLGCSNNGGSTCQEALAGVALKK